MAGIARRLLSAASPSPPPCVLLVGRRDDRDRARRGRGGRNVEFLLSLASRSTALKGVQALAGDTDGVDGVEEIAGAILTPDTLESRLGQAGIRPKDALADNDGHGFFGALGDQVVTGPTLTNVNDFAP